MKISMIFTNDWELFGDGSGDFTDLQERPLAELLQVFNLHAAKMTIFAEVGQQWAHRALGEREPWAKEIADRWEVCLRDGVRQGHDVQLHLHPTWTKAEFRGGRWCLDFSRWALTALSTAEIAEVIRRGRETLEQTLKPANPNYRCLAFRAGAFCIQPEVKTMPSILGSGIKCDSSVVPGARDAGFYDYSAAPRSPGAYRASTDDLCRPVEDGLLELPVHTRWEWESPILRKLFGIGAQADDVHFKRWLQEKVRRLEKIYPSGEQAHAKASSKSRFRLSRWPGFVLRRKAVILDYDEIGPKKFVDTVEEAVDAADPGRTELVLVAMGHAKTIPSSENADRILGSLKSRFGADVAFPTLREVYDRLEGKSA